MGNASVHDPSKPLEPAQWPPEPDPVSGILAHVGGEYIARGGERLPKPGPGLKAQPAQTVVLPDVPDLGAVRVTYELNSYRHGRSQHWHWRAVHAEIA